VTPQCDTLESFCAYVSDFAEGFLRTAGLRCRLDLPEEPTERLLSAEARHHLMLVVKEALNNASRHAVASEVRIGLDVGANALSLTIADNGRGFPLGQAPAAAGPATPDHRSAGSGGRGLVNMRRRVAALGGQVTIRSELGLGTRITAYVPLRRLN